MWERSDRHMLDQQLVSYGQILLHTSQLQGGHEAHQVLSGPRMKSTLCFQVEALDLSDSLSLNTDQWKGVVDGLEVCRSVRGQNLVQVLRCSIGYFETVPCIEKK